jgi:hypothetical protein
MTDATQPTEPTDPSQPDQLRASDTEREAIVARLNDACGEGRLSLTEFSDRVQQAYQARTRGDLQQLVADLPATATTPASPQASARTHWHISPIGGLHRRGGWRMAPRTVTVTVIGGANLDLSDAELAAPEVQVTTVSIIGGVRLRVPPGIRVEVSGFSLIGGRSLEIDDAPPGSPTVRVRHYGIIGGVDARSSRPLERWRRAISRRFT